MFFRVAAALLATVTLGAAVAVPVMADVSGTVAVSTGSAAPAVRPGATPASDESSPTRADGTLAPPNVTAGTGRASGTPHVAASLPSLPASGTAPFGPLAAGVAGAVNFAGTTLASLTDPRVTPLGPLAARVAGAVTPVDIAPSSAPELNATIAFTGDVLLHSQVNTSARTSKGYDYAKLFKPISPWITGADLAICQLEVPLTAPGRPVSSYPVFGAPHPVVAGLAREGWDGCATATNHSLDQGWAGIKTTLGTLASNHMGNTGMASSARDAQVAQFYQLTQDGQTLTIAHLSTSYGFNGFSEPKGKPWAVAKNNVKQIVARAKAARAAGADIVLLSVHFGTEYVTSPSSSQQRFVSAIAKTGAIDAVIGGHPHVAEPITKVPGGVGGKGMWVAYSLGNLISNMTQPIRSVGLVAYVHVTKDADGARVTGMTWSVVAVDLYGGHRLRMLEDAHGKGMGAIPAGTASGLRKAVAKIVGKTAAEQKRPPTPSGATLTVLPHGVWPVPPDAGL